MNATSRRLFFACACLALAGCGGSYSTKPETTVVTPEAKGVAFACNVGEAAHDCDRRAILSMAGEFKVRFAFDETVPILPGYAMHPQQRSGATEWVTVVKDTPDFISLQHILVMGDDHTVVKHWRQDWTWEPARSPSFRGRKRWDTVAIGPDVARGAWLQSVFEVDDSPRYFGVGHWTHADGVSAWTSTPTWRPLPRREYTKRDDYQVMVATNRHTLMPGGWVHEQDNTKLVLGTDGSRQVLVREAGLNTYTRITDYDFAAGREYWKQTGAYWAIVRARWDALFASHPQLSLREKVDDKLLYEQLFALADRAAKGEAIGAAEIDAVLAKYAIERGAATAAR